VEEQSWHLESLKSGLLVSEISIMFQHLENAFVRLIITDNGIGMPVESDWHHSESTGFSLISMLASQIDAELKIYSEKGLSVSVHFQPS